MKKFLIGLFSILIIGIVILYTVTNTKDTELTKVKVGEVTRSVFYAPQYVAIANGYFEDEGIDIELSTIPGADKVTAAVLSNDVQVGFCGSEATIYVYNQGEKDYLQTFAGLTKRDGSFIVSRDKLENFELTDLIGKDVIGGRAGGMPEMTFEYALSSNGIDPKEDVNINTSIDFSAMSGAFIGGEGDFVTLFEPQALQLEKEGYGYVVASVGEYGGTVPYTAYNARKSYIEKNPKIIEGFNKAIDKGLKFVKENDSEKIASIIVDYFPDITLSELEEIVERYKKADSWYESTYISEKDFNHIQTITMAADMLENKVDYKDLVADDYMIK